jgi:hypothetical protein
MKTTPTTGGDAAPTTAPASTAETLPTQLRRYADAIENELTIGRPRRVGDASDCSSPVMREAATIIDQLRAELAALKAVAPAAGGVVEWQPIDTAPATGYFLVCDEDGESIRTKLRLDGEWHDVEYPFIEHAPWGDKSVGSDALRILRLAQADPMCPMKLGVSDGCPEPAFWCQIPKFDAARLPQAAQKEGE